MNNKQLDDLASRIADNLKNDIRFSSVSEEKHVLPCPLGLTPDERTQIKSLCRILSTASQTITRVIVTIVVTALLGLIAAGFIMKIKSGL